METRIAPARHSSSGCASACIRADQCSSANYFSHADGTGLGRVGVPSSREGLDLGGVILKFVNLGRR